MMSIKLMSQCWELTGLTPIQKLLLISLADQANDDGFCWPGLQLISTRTSLCERAVRKNLRELEKLCLLMTEKRTLENNINMHTSNMYRITLDRYTNDVVIRGGAPNAPPLGHQMPQVGHQMPGGGAPNAPGVGHQMPPNPNIESKLNPKLNVRETGCPKWVPGREHSLENSFEEFWASCLLLWSNCGCSAGNKKQALAEYKALNPSPEQQQHWLAAAKRQSDAVRTRTKKHWRPDLKHVCRWLKYREFDEPVQTGLQVQDSVSFADDFIDFVGNLNAKKGNVYEGEKL